MSGIVAWPEATVLLVQRVRLLVQQFSLAADSYGKLLLRIAAALNTSDALQSFCGIVDSKRSLIVENG